MLRKWARRFKPAPVKVWDDSDREETEAFHHQSNKVQAGLEEAKQGKAKMSGQPQEKEEKTLPLSGIAEKQLVDTLVAAFAQSTGKQRDHNEDSLFLATCTLTNQQQKYPFGVYVVADGMGGHSNGEIASGMAARGFGKNLLSILFPWLVDHSFSIEKEAIENIILEAIKETHQLIAQNAPGGGTTLTAALVLLDQVMIVHVGDSRAYYISREGNIQVLTRDHSFVRKLVEMGQITPEEAALHPQRNVLYRALGQSDTYEVDYSFIPLPEEGHLLICSDGLWGVVPEPELVRITNSFAHPEQIAQKLVDAANAAGGPDNITAILVRIQAT
jgi:protein phosphatase